MFMSSAGFSSELTVSDPSLAANSHLSSLPPASTFRSWRLDSHGVVGALDLEWFPSPCLAVFNHQGLQMRLLQLQAVSQLQRELSTQDRNYKCIVPN